MRAKTVKASRRGSGTADRGCVEAVRRSQRQVRRTRRRFRCSCIEEQGRLQEYLDKHDAWTLDSRLELAMDALRCPPADTPCRRSIGR